MPKMTVYLPDDLYEIAKERGFPVSELLQGAIRREIDREQKRAAADRLVEELVEEHGEPTARDVSWAETLVHGRPTGARRTG